MRLNLLSVKGITLSTVHLPDLGEKMPDVIVSGGRYFVLDKTTGEYREGMVYFTDRQGL